MQNTLKNFGSIALVALFALVFTFGVFSYANAAWSSGGGDGSSTGTCCSSGGGGGGSYSGGGGGGGYTYTPPTYNPPRAPTCTLSADRTTIVSGQSVELTWSSSRGIDAYLSSVGTVSLNGSQSVSPTQTQTYTFTVYGEGGTKTCAKTINVTTPPPVVPVCTISASPETITRGQSATLSWSSSNASSASLSSGGSVATNGSQVVSPTYTQNYVLTVVGQGGTATCTKTIVVNVPPVVYDAPTCNIYISNYNQNYNYNNQYGYQAQPVTISWSSQYAHSGWINQGVGTVALTGSRTVYPTQTTVYTATFVGQNGQQVTCSATVNINTYVPPPIYQNPAPYVTLSAVPYTGLELGPVGTVLYWGFLIAWTLFAAYLIAIKRAHMSIYRWYSKALFGAETTSATHSTQVLATPAGAFSQSELAHIVQQLAALVDGKPAPKAHTTATVGAQDSGIDPFVLSQINRPRN